MINFTTPQIGDRFIPRDNNKERRIYTVIDILTTTNSKGEIVRRQAQATHELACQQVLSLHAMATVSMNKI